MLNAPGLCPMTGKDWVEKKATVIHYKDSCISFVLCGVDMLRIKVYSNMETQQDPGDLPLFYFILLY